MGFYVSAGVYPRELDISVIVPRLSTTIAALVGYSAKGTLDINLVTNKQQFIKEYGKPIPGNYFHYSALAFLENGSRLYCRRIVDSAMYPGVHIMDESSDNSNAAFSVGKLSAVFASDSSYPDELFTIFAKDPGEWGNKISVIIKNIKHAHKVQNGGIAYECLQDHISDASTEPGASGGADYWEATTDPITDLAEWSADSKNYVEEETEAYTFEIDVYFTDDNGITLKVENWKVSRKTKADGHGRQLNLENRINNYSAYIMVADSTRNDIIVPLAQTAVLAFAGGDDGSVPSASDIVGTESDKSGWYGFANPDDIDIRILIDGGFTSSHSVDDIVIIQQAMKAIAESRKDCFAVMSTPYSECEDVDDTVTFRTVTQNINSSYSGLYAPWAKINDPYNDMIIEVPPSGYVASMLAYNDYVGAVWKAAAGWNRGILNTLSLSKVYTQGERDLLYENSINPLQVKRGRGNVIWGQKTLQKKASALDRINVRRSLIILEKAISISLEDFAFENNDDITRYRISSMIDTYLGQLSAAGAFQLEGNDKGYLIVCDETNNPPAITDTNELHVDIFVKPVRTAEFIQLQTIVTPSGASFTELVSRGVNL